VNISSEKASNSNHYGCKTSLKSACFLIYVKKEAISGAFDEHGYIPKHLSDVYDKASKYGAYGDQITVKIITESDLIRNTSQLNQDFHQVMKYFL
jgi:hypothetical protein